MSNTKSPWNNKQNDTESASTTILSKPNPKVTAAVLPSSSLTSSWWELAQADCLLRGSIACCDPDADAQGGHSGVCAAWGQAGRKLQWICLLLVLLQPPSWDCGAELSQITLIPFSYQAQVLVSNVEHNDLF
ncbi:hypothetical protein RLOC_00000356 [Lonchura striata]|uniref:Uncharacterized protein n=1 Tax=Lonchura striata TaxID=40157 RepID=A0A218V6V4_9PASE|nr:hypothetical protein RLOC_00000356 [Lonchura striata domestica]